MVSLEEIKSEKYIALETYRKNGEPVKTPVWFVINDDFVYVVTRSHTGKVKRLKNNPKIKFTPCTIKGKITGEWISGTVKTLDVNQTKNAIEMRDKKYGFMAKIAKFLSKGKGELFAFSIKID